MIYISDCQFCDEARPVIGTAQHCGATECAAALAAVEAPIRFTDGSRGRVDIDGAVQMAHVALLRLLAAILFAGLSLSAIGSEVAR